MGLTPGVEAASLATAPAGEEPSSLFAEEMQVPTLTPQTPELLRFLSGSGWVRLGWDADPRGCRLGDAAWQTSRLAMARFLPIPAEAKTQGRVPWNVYPLSQLEDQGRACPASNLHGEKERESKRVALDRHKCLLKMQVCGQETKCSRAARL